MQYSVKHVTLFKYLGPVRESAMEVRLQPRSDSRQTCYSFSLNTEPVTNPHSYVDHAGNTIHYFDIAAEHEQLRLESRAIVDVTTPVLIPEATATISWDDLDRAVEDSDLWDFLQPSRYVQQTEALADLSRNFAAVRRDDPLTVLLDLSARIYSEFDYRPLTTHANSPIDDALKDRSGVCQDFAHILIALMRRLGVPSRYVSGYLFHRSEDGDRSAQDASHAWAEAFLPGLGWLGLDPTNNIVAGERHICVAYGRDYADVPPTKGVFKGLGAQELQVGVRVVPAAGDAVAESDLKLSTMPHALTAEQEAAFERYRLQQQQQQQ